MLRKEPSRGGLSEPFHRRYKVAVEELPHCPDSFLARFTLKSYEAVFAWPREGGFMPGKKHLRGVGAKEQRQYEHIKENSEKSGRYGKRATEVAARTVMKQHKEKGHTKGT
jgi:hypothetical protein